jgi:hypothetical protein
MESHYGVMSAWIKAHHPNYNPNNAPAVLMPNTNHDQTRGVYNTWRTEMNENLGGTFDRTRVENVDMKQLSDRMFDVANVPADVRAEYDKQFNIYVKDLST